MAEKKPTNAVSQVGRGVDVGTAFMVSARAVSNEGGESNSIQTNAVRNCFISTITEQGPMLDISGVAYVTGKKSLYVVGDEAVNLAGVLGGEPRRPLSKGFISADEEDAKEIVTLILSKILKDPIDGEVAVYSVPGPLMKEGKPDANSGVFHTSFFNELISGLGFKARALNEAAAVVYSECLHPFSGPDGKTVPPLTAVGISFGAGMINFSVCYKSMPVKSFSIPFGGDYVDAQAAAATGSPAAHITMLKEHGVNVVTGEIVNPTDQHDDQSRRQAEAISLMYRDLIRKLLEEVNAYFAKLENRMEIKETLPIIVSGGTTLAPGFIELFNAEFMDKLDVRWNFYAQAVHARYPLDSVARGCLNLGRIQSRMQGL